MFNLLNNLQQLLRTAFNGLGGLVDEPNQGLVQYNVNSQQQSPPPHFEYRLPYTSKSNEDFYCPYEFNRSVSDNDIESKPYQDVGACGACGVANLYGSGDSK